MFRHADVVVNKAVKDQKKNIVLMIVHTQSTTQKKT